MNQWAHPWLLSITCSLHFRQPIRLDQLDQDFQVFRWIQRQVSMHFFGAVYVSKWLRFDLAFTTTTIVTVVMVMVMILVIAKVLMLMMIYENGLWRSWHLLTTIIIMDSCCLPVFHGFGQPFQAASSQSRSSRPRRQPRSSLQRGPSWSFSKASLSWRFLISACRLCLFFDVCVFSALAFARVVLVVVWNSHGAYWTDHNHP